MNVDLFCLGIDRGDNQGRLNCQFQADIDLQCTQYILYDCSQMLVEQFQGHIEYNLFVTVDFDICQGHKKNTILILVHFVSSLPRRLCILFVGLVHLTANIYQQHKGHIFFDPPRTAICRVRNEDMLNYRSYSGGNLLDRICKL